MKREKRHKTRFAAPATVIIFTIMTGAFPQNFGLAAGFTEGEIIGGLPAVLLALAGVSTALIAGVGSSKSSKNWKEYFDLIREYYDKGKYDLAAAYAEYALKKADFESIDSDDLKAKTYSKLAEIFDAGGSSEIAMKNRFNALKLYRGMYGRNDPKYAKELVGLASALEKNDRGKDSERLLNKALTIHENSRGDDRDKMAALSSLAHLYLGEGRADDALTTALNLQSHAMIAFGEYSKERAEAFELAGDSHAASENYDKAAEAYEKSASIFSEIGEKSKAIGAEMKTAEIMEKIGDLDRAIELYENLRIKIRLLEGRESKNYLKAERNLIKNYLGLGEFEKAETEMIGALKLLYMLQGKSGSEFVLGMNELVNLSAKIEEKTKTSKTYLLKFENPRTGDQDIYVAAKEGWMKIGNS